MVGLEAAACRRGSLSLVLRPSDKQLAGTLQPPSAERIRESEGRIPLRLPSEPAQPGSPALPRGSRRPPGTRANGGPRARKRPGDLSRRRRQSSRASVRPTCGSSEAAERASVMFWRSRGLSEAHERGALGRHERLFADATTLLALDSGDTPQSPYVTAGWLASRTPLAQAWAFPREAAPRR
jgi:hypothetical protein